MQHHNFLHESMWQDCTKSHPWTWATARCAWLHATSSYQAVTTAWRLSSSTASLVPCFLQLSSAHIHLKCHAADVGCTYLAYVRMFVCIDWLYSSICTIILFPKHGDVGDSPDAHHKNRMVLQLFPHCTNWNSKVWALAALYSGSAVKNEKRAQLFDGYGPGSDLLGMDWVHQRDTGHDHNMHSTRALLCDRLYLTSGIRLLHDYIRLNLCRLDLVGRLD